MEQRATIDPNHTPAVEGDHYLTATTPAQRHAVETIVEDAQHDILRRAPPAHGDHRRGRSRAGDGYPQLLVLASIATSPDARKLDAGAIAELVSGARDVFTAACGDQFVRTAWAEGQTMPGPAVGLSALPAAAPVQPAQAEGVLLRQWRQMPTAQFVAIFGPYAVRIDQILDRFETAEVTAAAARCRRW